MGQAHVLPERYLHSDGRPWEGVLCCGAEGRQVRERLPGPVLERGSVWNGHPDAHRQARLYPGEPKEGCRVDGVMLLLAGSVSCSRAGFLCPAVHLLGEIRAWRPRLT